MFRGILVTFGPPPWLSQSSFSLDHVDDASALVVYGSILPRPAEATWDLLQRFLRTEEDSKGEHEAKRRSAQS